jgi:hypothetical protein
MAWIESITVDAEHPAALARFWAAALDGYAVRAYDETEVARLAELGLTPETDASVMVDGPGPTLCFQRGGAAEPMHRESALSSTVERVPLVRSPLAATWMRGPNSLWDRDSANSARVLLKWAYDARATS